MKIKPAILAATLGLACFTFTSAAAQPFLAPSNPPPVVQLAWNPSPTASFYNVYYGVGPGQYTNRTVLANQTNVNVTLPARGVAFFFAVTATDSHALESKFSNEVTYTPPNPPVPPVQQGISIITVMASPTPTGVFVDAGMNWSTAQNAPQTYYKLKIQQGMFATTLAPSSKRLPPSLPTTFGTGVRPPLPPK